MCFSNSPWVFIHSYIYLMRKVIMKIEFLSNALINQMTQAEHHLLWIVLKVNFSPKELLMIFTSFTGAVYSKPWFDQIIVWTNFQVHIRNFFIEISSL